MSWLNQFKTLILWHNDWRYLLKQHHVTISPPIKALKSFLMAHKLITGWKVFLCQSLFVLISSYCARELLGADRKPCASLYGAPSHPPTASTDFFATGFYFVEKMLPGFTSDVLWLLCLNSVINRAFRNYQWLLRLWLLVSSVSRATDGLHVAPGSVCFYILSQLLDRHLAEGDPVDNSGLE